VTFGQTAVPTLLTLVCHPSCDPGAVDRIGVCVRRAPDSLGLRFLLDGRLDRLAIPPLRAPERRAELWRHTCFEVFVRRPGESAYAEFNLSPSGEWAAYRFDAYRSGMRELELVQAPETATRCGDGRLDASLRIAPAPEPWHRAEALHIAVSAVVEGADGALAYWALAHPAGAPDFHHPAGFVLEFETVCGGPGGAARSDRRASSRSR
jgi:hypothetical protein